MSGGMGGWERGFPDSGHLLSIRALDPGAAERGRELFQEVVEPVTHGADGHAKPLSGLAAAKDRSVRKPEASGRAGPLSGLLR